MKCLLCAIFKASSDMQSRGMADLQYFENQWKSLSCAMNPERQVDPHDVLYMFLSRIRVDLCETSKTNCCTSYFNEMSPVTRILEGEHCLEVICDACGDFSKVVKFLSVELAVELSDNPQCPSPGYKLQGRFIFESNEYELLGCIVDNSVAPFFINLCPDGKVRVFQDAKITTIIPAKLYLAEYLTTSKLTLLYSKVEKVCGVQKTVNTSRTRKSTVHDTTKIKIVSYPSLDEADIPTEPMKYRTVGSQTEPVPEKVNEAAAVKNRVTKVVKKTRIPVKKPILPPLISYQTCKSHKKFKFFTGLSKEDFEILYMLIGGDEVVRYLKLFYRVNTPKKAVASKLSGRDRLFILLLRMRRGLPLEELAFLFRCSVAYVGEICYVMTRLVYLTLKAMENYMFVPAAKQCIRKPNVMKPFPNLRVILDGVSFYIETPSNFEQQGNTYSQYKSHNVLVVAVGISCHGATVFCSDAYEGSISDKQTIIQSGLLDMLEPGDGVMTDRGYELTAELQAKGCHFYKPPSLGGREHFTAEEEILTKAVASARIYCEHAMADIKDWRILQGTIPIKLLPVISNLVYIAAFLRNFQPNRVRNKRFVAASQPDETTDQGQQAVG